MARINEFVKHLRNIHFTLLLASLTLILAPVVIVEDEVELALKELDVLEEQVKKIHRNAQKVLISYSDKNLIRKKIYGDPEPKTIEEYSITHLDEKFQFSLRDQYWIFENDELPISIDHPFFSLEGNIENKSISDFVKIWEEFASIRIVKFSGKLGDAYFNGEEVKYHDNENGGSTFGFGDLGPIRRIDDFTTLEYGLYYERKTSPLVFPVETEIEALDFRQNFIEVLNLDIAPRPFEELFPNLNKLTFDARKLSIKNWRRIIEQRKNDATTRVPLLSADFSYGNIQLIGPWLLLMVYFYFYLHYSEYKSFYSKEKSKLEIPWIGNYGGVSKVFFFVTVSILPTFSVVLITWPFLMLIDPSVPFFSSLFAIILSYLLSLITGRLIFKPNKSVGTNENESKQGA